MFIDHFYEILVLNSNEPKYLPKGSIKYLRYHRHIFISFTFYFYHFISTFSFLSPFYFLYILFLHFISTFYFYILFLHFFSSHILSTFFLTLMFFIHFIGLALTLVCQLRNSLIEVSHQPNVSHIENREPPILC